MVLAIFCPMYAGAQQHSLSTFGSHRLEVFGQYGYVFPTNDFVRGINNELERINHYQAYSARYVIQTDGDKNWERLYDYPSWGAGLYVADFFEKEQVGTPIAAYMFLAGPFTRWNNWSFNYDLGFGLAFNWKAFNAESNSYNKALGASQSVYIDVGLNLRYAPKGPLEYALGFSLSHFSNGALKQPNLGLNTIAPKLSVGYRLDNRSIIADRKPLEVFHKKREWLITAFGGATNIIFDSVDVSLEQKYRGAYFPIAGFNVLRNWQVSQMSKIGAGLTYAYNGSVNAQIAIEQGKLEPADAPFFEKTQLSVNVSYELVVNRLSLVLQPSYYLYRKQFQNQKPALHQIVGLKYYLGNNLFAGISLRAHKFYISDFIVWQLGYRF